MFRLADGFHRVAAAEVARLAELPARVLQGTGARCSMRSARNADHGLDRTPEDKDRAVRAMLDDPEWGVWSDSEIARRCRVSQPFVGKVRGIVEREQVAARGSAPAEMRAGAQAHRQTRKRRDDQRWQPGRQAMWKSTRSRARWRLLWKMQMLAAPRV